jgi:putative tryptophan/tyrosine transport system substrate-binding protein
MRRRDFLADLCGVAVCSQIALAQVSGIPRIGFLSSRSADESGSLLTGFRRGLRDNGFVEGQTVEIEYRWADNNYERLASLANDLIGRHVALIVAAGGPASAFAAKAATTTIPIVFTSVGDPVEIGLVASLGHPGGNVTGTDATLTIELDAKRLELLHELLPEIRSVAALVNPTRPGSEGQTSQLKAAARDLGIDVIVLPASQQADIDTAFNQLVRQGLKALLVGSDPFFASRREQLVKLAARNSVPAIYQWPEFVSAGGLMSYGASLADAYWQAGEYTSRILKGAKPADLPVARPTKFEFLINTNTAKALGLTIPPSLLARADLIE